MRYKPRRVSRRLPEPIGFEELKRLLIGATVTDVRFYEAYCSGEPCETIVIVTDRGEIEITASGPEGASLSFYKVPK